MKLKKTTTARERIARNLINWRKERGLSQEELAAAAEMSQTFYSQIETATRNVSIDKLEKLAHSLEVDIIDLLAP